MGLLRFIAIGAAVGYGINYLIKKNEDGRSILDDVVDDAPQWFEKAKKFAEEKVEQAVNVAQTNS